MMGEKLNRLTFKQRIHVADVLRDMAGEKQMLQYNGTKEMLSKVKTHLDESIMDGDILTKANVQAICKEVDIKLILIGVNGHSKSLFTVDKRIADLETLVLQQADQLADLSRIVMRMNNKVEGDLAIMIRNYVNTHSNTSTAMAAAMKKAVTVS